MLHSSWDEEAAIAKYFKDGYTYAEICMFLRLRHNCNVTIDQLRYKSKKMGLGRRCSEENTQITANIDAMKSLNDSKEERARCLPQLSQKERARCVVEQRKISLDPNLQAFTVMGTNKPHVVTLDPKETCSCPSNTSCYHILAAKLSIGENSEPAPKMKLSLTQLRKNLRNCSEKSLDGRNQDQETMKLILHQML